MAQSFNVGIFGEKSMASFLFLNNNLMYVFQNLIFCCEV
jgi:hypothetical protein